MDATEIVRISINLGHPVIDVWGITPQGLKYRVDRARGTITLELPAPAGRQLLLVTYGVDRQPTRLAPAEAHGRAAQAAGRQGRRPAGAPWWRQNERW